MTAHFNQHGLNFQYPENWKLQVNDPEPGTREVHLLAPSGAFWSVLILEESQSDGHGLIAEIIAGLDEQYDALESEPIADSIAGHQTAGFDVHFYCLDLLISTRIFLVEFEKRQYMLMFQAEDREFEQMELVFKAISISMLSSLGTVENSTVESSSM